MNKDYVKILLTTKIDKLEGIVKGMSVCKQILKDCKNLESAAEEINTVKNNLIDELIKTSRDKKLSFYLKNGGERLKCF